MADGVVFAVAGAKGGVGKTTTSINASAVLAALGYDVLLVELDVAMANVGDVLDLGISVEHGTDPTLHDVLAGTDSLANATYEAPGGFDAVPSGTSLTGFSNADIDRSATVVAEGRSRYDVVVLDTASGLGVETVLPLSLADETILVSSPRVASVRDTKKTRNLVRHADGAVAGVVFVGTGSERSPGVDRIAEFLSVDLLGHVPDDPAVPSAEAIGRPVVVADGDSAAASAYGALGSRIYERINALQATKATERENVTGPEIDASADGRRASAATAAETDAAPDVDGADPAYLDVLDASESTGTKTADVAERWTTRDQSNQSEADTEESGSRSDAVEQPTARDGETPTETPEATDDEIAERLANFEQATNGDETGDDADDDGDSGESWEDKETAAKRFIDEAIRRVDRHSD